MNHEIKSGDHLVATITTRQAVAFQVSAPGDEGSNNILVPLRANILVPLWANTVAIDEDGSIWAYESTEENICNPDGCAEWLNLGSPGSNFRQIGFIGYTPGWKEAKVDLRSLK